MPRRIAKSVIPKMRFIRRTILLNTLILEDFLQIVQRIRLFIFKKFYFEITDI
jgi:hypothetical protein